jgi:cytoskeletal protein CcmA (bactofilin family)
VRIDGEVKGDIEGLERVVICASGEVQGNLTAPRVVLEDGGRFKGSIDMGGTKKSGGGTKPAAPASKDSAPGIDKAS